MAKKLVVEPMEVLPLLAEPSSPNLNATITLKNEQMTPVLFRIQTTSPLSYRVKPSHGWVLPGAVQTVTVLHVGQVNPSASNGALGKTDKFLIKFGPIGGAETLPDRDSPQASEKFTQLWATLTEISECRLRCSFPGEQVQKLDKPSPSPSPAQMEQNVSEKGSFKNIDEDSNNGAVLALKEQLAQANQKIAQLEAKIANSAGQRKDHLSSAEVSGDMAQTIDAILAAQSKSLPPVLIILIALFCFLLGLLF